ncbi:MAG TPA: tetratricopeptide repeat protein [Pyrinomonadaceae bacterium]
MHHEKREVQARRLPAPARVAAALACSALSLWCAWAAVRAGASRVVSDYAARAGSKEAADASVALAPSDPEAHYARGNVLADSGDYAGAASAYEAALGLRPRDHVIWVELGRAREETGDTAGALEAFRRAVALAPFYARPRWQLGNTLLRAGPRAEAVAELRRAAESDPRLYPNLVQTLWHASGRDPGALMRDARPLTPEQTLAVVRLLVREGESGQGLKALRERGAELTDDARRTLVADLIAAGRFAEAHSVWSGGRDPVGSLTDGGFEAGARSDEDGFGWRFAGRGQNVRLSLDADSPREGARSLKVEYAGNSEPAEPAVSRLVAVEPGARYRLTFSSRTKELLTGGPPFVEVVPAAKSGGALAESAALPASTQGWQEFALEFTAPEAGGVRVALRRRPCATSPCPAFGGVWLDAFELRRL